MRHIVLVLVVVLVLERVCWWLLALELNLCALPELYPADAGLEVLSGRNFLLHFPGLKPWAVLLNHFMVSRTPSLLWSFSFASAATSARGLLRNCFRPFSEEIAEVVGRCILDIIMYNLIHVFPVNVHGRDLELAMLVRQRFYIEFALLSRERHG